MVLVSCSSAVKPGIRPGQVVAPDDGTLTTRVGHYWRSAVQGPNVSGGKRELFDDVDFNEWSGPKRNVFCVDFSVGGRYRERARNVSEFATRLGAVRWPERQLVFEDGATSTMIP